LLLISNSIEMEDSHHNGKLEIKSEDEIIGFFEEKPFEGKDLKKPKAAQPPKVDGIAEEVYKALHDIWKKNQENASMDTEFNQMEESLNLKVRYFLFR